MFSRPYLHAVYYIKKQAKIGNNTFYLISTKPSSSDGTVGWVKAEDLSTHPHVGKDKKKKTLYFKGTGKAYAKAWGGKQDLVHDDMSKYKGQEFKVNLTEKVGNNTWYRGTFQDETIWLHESYVASRKESKTSKLGHIRKKATIYETLGDVSSALNTEKYLNAVYYIKKQAKIDNKTYYLISKKPSSSTEVVGWVESDDLSIHPHVGVDKKAKTLYVKGDGSAYIKAWGGSKDIVYEDLAQYKNKKLIVDLTEKVGNNTWYRGMLEGKRVWIHSSYLKIGFEYNITLDKALDIQMKVSPQTDSKEYAWVSKSYIKNNKVTASALNVRPNPNDNEDKIGRAPV